MQRVNYVTETDWLTAYWIRIRDRTHPLDGQTVGYGRVWAQRVEGPYDDDLTRFNRRAANFISLFQIQAPDRILVEGCGFGFLIEAFKAASCPNCFGVESSPYVVTEKDSEADPNSIVVESDTRGGEALKTELTNKTGDSSFDWVITECLLESYDDVDLNNLLDAAEEALDKTKSKSNVIHLVMSVQDPAKPDRSINPIFNQKTLAEWRAVRPDHSWVDCATWEVESGATGRRKN